MTSRVAIVLLLLGATSAWAATLSREQLVGAWITAEPLGVKGMIAHWLFTPSADRLEISKDFGATLTRHTNDTSHTLRAEPSEVTFSEDLLIVRFSSEPGCTCKLVLSGWSSGNTKRLFGHLYIYGKEGLVNGIAVSYEPEHGS